MLEETMSRFSLPWVAPVTLLQMAIALTVHAHADLAGSIFLTGHDPDFDASLGSNALGAQRINQAATNFIMDPAFNTFVASGNRHSLFVECDTRAVPAGHVDGVPGVIDSAAGFPAGTTFETYGAADGLARPSTQLGTKFNAIVIGSDSGGMLTLAELDLLNADSAGIISFLNSGGGLYAMAETTPANNGLASTGFSLFCRSSWQPALWANSNLVIHPPLLASVSVLQIAISTATSRTTCLHQRG
jgi:hypothetical protein